MSKRVGKHSRSLNRQEESGSRTLWIILFLVVVTILLYSNTIGHGFVFDDVTLITQNPQVLEFDIPGIFSMQGYRPVRTLTHAVEWMLSGGKPGLFHADNILLHVLNVLLLFFFLKRITRSRIAALAGSLVFMVHPVQTAAVAYISGRKDLLATAFLLLGFLLYLKAGDAGKSNWWKIAPAWACFVLALLSKEVAIVFPVMLLGIDMVAGVSMEKSSLPGQTFFSAMWTALRKRPLQYAVFSVLAALSLVWAVFINLASRAEGYWGGSLLTNLGTGFKLFSTTT